MGIPAEVVAPLRHAPFRPTRQALAPSLVYEATILGNMDRLSSRLSAIAIPTLLLSGEASPAMLGDAAQAVADTLPHAQHRRLPGQTHDLVAEILAPVLETFLMS